MMCRLRLKAQAQPSQAQKSLAKPGPSFGLGGLLAGLGILKSLSPGPEPWLASLKSEFKFAATVQLVILKFKPLAHQNNANI